MKRSHKPCRKCHSCGLNFGDHCGIHPKPKAMWHHRTCPGFQNEQMLAEFEDAQKKHPPNYSKEQRREAARKRNAEPHWQGVLPLANR